MPTKKKSPAGAVALRAIPAELLDQFGTGPQPPASKQGSASTCMRCSSAPASRRPDSTPSRPSDRLSPSVKPIPAKTVKTCTLKI